jgi:shikimate kinase
MSHLIPYIRKSLARTGGGLPESMVDFKEIPHVCLVGFAGSGKSTIGRVLARRLGRTLVDTDMLIEHKTGLTIPDLFERHGEKYFRKVETSVIVQLVSGKAAPMVIAIGGGAFQGALNRKALQKSAVIVYLSCPMADLYARLKNRTGRPMLNAGPESGSASGRRFLEKIKALLSRRRKFYEMADLRVSTHGKTREQTVDELMRKLVKRYAYC